MKRLAASLFGSSVVPVTVLFVLTAHPARLYAEEGVLRTCEAVDYTEACSGLGAGATCTVDAGTGTCGTLCRASDGGVATDLLQCWVVPTTVPEAGNDAGDDAGADAAADAAPDAPAQETPGTGDSSVDTEDAATMAAPPPVSNGKSGSAGDSGGCSTTTGSPTGLASSFVGLLLAACAMWRMRRRPR